MKTEVDPIVQDLLTMTTRTEGGLNLKDRISATPEKTSQNYAWGRLAYLLCHPSLIEALENTPPERNFVFVDICSAIPVLGQIVRERHFNYVWQNLRRPIIREYFYRLLEKDPVTKKPIIPAVAAFERKTLEELSHRDNLFRQLLTTIVQDILCSPPPVIDKRCFEEELLRRFCSSRKIYTPKCEPNHQQEPGELI